jgi:uncharacterized delta-60 repeat protein
MLVMRFMPDGSLDTTFNGTGALIVGPPGGTATGRAIAVQSDGKILVAGGFGTDLYLRHFTVLRFLPDGSPDLTFNGSGEVISSMGNISDTINAMVLQKDGKIVVAGTAESTTPPGSPHVQTSQFAVARYLPDGQLDPEFNGTGKYIAGGALEFDARAFCVMVQEDGKIVAGGIAHPDAALLRLDSQGRPDPTFNGTGQATYALGSARPSIQSMVLDSAGRIVAAGGFRVEETGGPAFVMEVLPDGSLDPLFRGTGFLTTSLGADSGAFFAAAREKEGTLLTAGAAPMGRSKVALARYQLREDLVLEHPAQTRLTNNSAEPLDFGAVAPGTTFREFTIRNMEGRPLTGLTVTISGESHPGEFAAGAPPVTTLPAGGSTTFMVSFTPSAAPGPHTATLRVRGTADEEHTFTVTLTGHRASPSEVWRYTWFATYDNTGAAADLHDFDADGMVNLMEFALGTHPHQPAPPPITLVKNGIVLEYTYTRPVTSLAELIHQPEFASTPAGPWSAEGITSTVVSDDGVMQSVRVAAPGAAGAGFVRLRVSRR